MIQIVLHRSLSGIIVCLDIRQWERGDTSHGRQVKSADSRRAGCGWESGVQEAIAQIRLLALFSKHSANQYAQRQLVVLIARLCFRVR